MSELAIPAAQPTPPIKSTDKPGRLQIRGKRKAALDAMIWGIDGTTPLKWNEAALAANFDVSAMRKALETAHVQAYLRAQRQVLRASICASNLSRLGEIRDQNANLNAAVSAVKVLEQMDDPEHSRGPALPFSGVVVNIITAAPAAKVIDHE